MNATARLTVVDLKREASKHGATVTRFLGTRWTGYMVDAPHGKTWASDPGLHGIKVEWLNGDADHRTQAIADAIERMVPGLDDCGEPGCDSCS